MAAQLAFDFAAGATIIRSPLCLYEQHCGAKAELGPPRLVGAQCENRTIRCLRCGCRGERSTRLDLRPSPRRHVDPA